MSLDMFVIFFLANVHWPNNETHRAPPGPNPDMKLGKQKKVRPSNFTILSVKAVRTSIWQLDTKLCYLIKAFHRASFIVTLVTTKRWPSPLPSQQGVRHQLQDFQMWHSCFISISIHALHTENISRFNIHVFHAHDAPWGEPSSSWPPIPTSPPIGHLQRSLLTQSWTWNSYAMHSQ